MRGHFSAACETGPFVFMFACVVIWSWKGTWEKKEVIRNQYLRRKYPLTKKNDLQEMGNKWGEPHAAGYTGGEFPSCVNAYPTLQWNVYKLYLSKALYIKISRKFVLLFIILKKYLLTQKYAYILQT